MYERKKEGGNYSLLIVFGISVSVSIGAVGPILNQIM